LFLFTQIGVNMKKPKSQRATFLCERLEPRCLMAGLPAVAWGDFQALIVAGDPNGSPPDSPAIRVDTNSAASPFAGVGSLQITANRGTFICTGTPIDRTRILTAAHCVDINDDGVSNKKDGIKSIKFNLNLDTDAGTDAVDTVITASSWRTHPDYTGFNRPAINDDLAVITLAGSGLPASVPTYSLVSSDMIAGETQLVMVGYGRSGDGISGYTTNASFTVKRAGENVADGFYGQDDSKRTAANEVFRFDFDGPTGNGGLGGPTLGNDRETTLGGGDSGGPSFVLVADGDPDLASSYLLAGVNTFSEGATAPNFGSYGGGMNVFPYRNWILSGTAPTVESSRFTLFRRFITSSVGLPLERILGADPSTPSSMPSSRDFVWGTTGGAGEFQVSMTSELAPRVSWSSPAVLPLAILDRTSIIEPLARTLEGDGTEEDNGSGSSAENDKQAGFDEIFGAGAWTEDLD